MSQAPKPATSKKLLELHGCLMNVGTLNNALLSCGVLESVEYLSSTGSGEVKNYLKIKDNFSHFGINTSNPFSKATEPRYFHDRFSELYKIAAEAVYQQALQLTSNLTKEN